MQRDKYNPLRVFPPGRASRYCRIVLAFYADIVQIALKLSIVSSHQRESIGHHAVWQVGEDRFRTVDRTRNLVSPEHKRSTPFSSNLFYVDAM
jgi:hypothetical protein